ncbi:MAG: DUF4215 domain-containing protein [Myxococcales bacterium]|nr:DUF4215 domain-containing protein [Myxococcales bacterium]
MGCLARVDATPTARSPTVDGPRWTLKNGSNLMTRNILKLCLLGSIFLGACDTVAGPGGEIDELAESGVSQRDAQPDPCASLTPAAIQDTVDTIDETIDLIEAYIDDTPDSNYYPEATYNVAGAQALDYLGQSRTKITDFQAALTTSNHGVPYVTWEGKAQDMFYAMGDAAALLQHAMWWGYLGAGYDLKEEAREAAKHAMLAQELTGELSRQALLCAMERHFPCGNGVVTGAEQCDDGNLSDGDGCSSTCETE